MLRVQRWGPDAPGTPRLAHSLRLLVGEVDEEWPHRLHASDGWIGDDAHQARQSDHNPDARGIVHAVDLTGARMRPHVVVTCAVLHPATNYVIYERLIWSRSHAFYPRYYDGDDPHRDHVHVSILQTVMAERSRRPWLGRRA